MSAEGRDAGKEGNVKLSEREWIINFPRDGCGGASSRGGFGRRGGLPEG